MIAARRILVVDDSDDNREAVSALLRFMKYSVREANCGDDALSIAESFKPELLLIDVKMSGMSGLQLLEKINDTGKTCESIMMTGHESVDDACKAIELGAIGYLRKPVRYEELVKHIGIAFEKVDGYISAERRKISLEEESIRHARKAEESFKVAEFQSRRFDLILDNMQEPLIAIDGDKRVMMVNRAAERAFDICAGKSLDCGYEEVFSGSSIVRCINRIGDNPKTGSDAVATDVLEYAGRYYSVSVSRLFHEGGPMAGHVLIFTDKTSQYQAEQLRMTFLSVVSHEFKTPLSILMNAATILGMKRHCSGEIELAKNNIDETCHRLARLVNAVVVFAKVNNNNVSLTLKPVDIESLLKQSIEKFSGAASKKTVTVSLIAVSAVQNVATDGEFLSAAVECIIDNAIKFSPECGKVGVHYFFTDEDNRKQVHIIIEDEGPGIPPEKTALLFEWFNQGEDPLRRKFGGLGLGLPLARRILSLLGGEITVGVANRGGCRVEMVVPVS